MTSTPVFDDLTASVDYPMMIVTAATDGRRAGCLVGFGTQCSIDPPRWIACISKANRTHEVVSASSVLVVHLLRASQRELAILFGASTGEDVDKFEQCAWSPGPGGAPVLADTDWFAGRVIERQDAGDHTAFLLQVLDDGDASHGDQAQLGFQMVRDLDPGHDADE